MPQYKTSEEARIGINKQLDLARQELNNAVKSGTIKNDSRSILASPQYAKIEELQRQLRGTGTLGEIGTGLMSTLVGGVTGIPDLAIAGVNYARSKMSETPVQPIPSLYPMGMALAGVPSEPTSEAAAPAFYGPDVATGVYGLSKLLTGGFKVGKDWFTNRKVKAFMDSLPEETSNTFKKFMMTGQGSDSPQIADVLQRLQRNPEYAEIFHKLEAGASQAALKGMTPEASRLSQEQAASGIFEAVRNKIEDISFADKEKASRIFEKAKEYGAQKPVLEPTQLRSTLDSLIAEFSKKPTPSSQNATEFLTALKTRITPGSEVYSKNMTAEAVQGILSEFGKKAAVGDTLLKDVSLSTENRISSAIFGSLKDDLRAARQVAKDNNEIASLDLLIKARNLTAATAAKYEEAIGKGLPAILKDKTINEVDFEDLYKTYKSLPVNQQAVTRSYIADYNPEALKNIDSRVYQDFVDMARNKTPKPDGTYGISMDGLASAWNKLKQTEKDSLATSMGQNADEFAKRMQDATVFSRRMQVGKAADTSMDAFNTLATDTARVAGASIGYQAYQGIQLAKDAIKQAFNTGLSDAQTMKLLLTAEGKDFLKTASLSPASAKTLEAFTKVEQAAPPSWAKLPVMGVAAEKAAQAATPAPQMPEIPQGAMPDVPMEAFAPAAPASEGAMPDIPAEVFGGAPAMLSGSPTSTPVDRRAILNQELAAIMQRMQNTGNPDDQQRAQADLVGIQREISRLPQ